VEVIEINLEELKKEMPEIFEHVKRDVRKVIKRQRAGLSLGLVEMGMYQGAFIGGMHFPPGTDIVMNITPLKILLEQQPDEIIYAYTYHILLHEYVHSLGVYDEMNCQALTLRISEEIFKVENHPALILAKKGIGAYFPNIRLIYAPPEMSSKGMKIEYISGFDKHSYEYYS
jgi:hypothetical protein